MAESTLSTTFTILKTEVAAFLGYGVTSGSWTAAQLAEIERYMQAGVRRFYYPPAVDGVEEGYQWSFMFPATTIATAASDAAQDLPDTLGRVLGPFYYSSSQHRPSIPQVSEDEYQALISRSTDEGPPQVARVRHKEQVVGAGQRLEVAWWPIPDAIYTLTYTYEAYSGVLSVANPYPLGGMRYAELLTESCLAVAEQRANDERGIHTLEFERLLKAAVQHDRKLSAKNFGEMAASSGASVVPRHGDTGISYDVTYKGSTW